MRNENHETEPGSFYIRSVHEGVSKVLKLKPDGTFTWGGNNVNTVVASGSGYIRYSSGLQICYGRITVNGTLSINNIIRVG